MREYIHKPAANGKFRVELDVMNSLDAIYFDQTPCKPCFLIDSNNVVQAYMYDFKLANRIAELLNANRNSSV